MPVTVLQVAPMQANRGAHGEHVRYAKNVSPFAGSYRPRQKQTFGLDLALTGATPEPPNSIYTHIYPSGTGGVSYVGDAATVFAGTQAHLFQVTDTGFTAVSRAALYAQTVGDEAPAWSFCSFGDLVIASNLIDEMQVQSARGAAFANLITSAFKPQARYVAVLRTSIIAANLDSAGGTRFPDEYAISVPGNAASHDPAGGAFTQRSIARPGQLTGVVGGEFARLFKTNSMSAVQFTGSSVVPWREDLISSTVGTRYGKSIVELRGGDVAFFGGDSFYRQSGPAGQPQKVGPQILPDFLEYAKFEPTLHPFPPLRVGVLPMTMAQEDGILFGSVCAKSGNVMWAYKPESGDNTDGAKWGILWEPDLDIWSFHEFPSDAVALASYPDIADRHIIGGIVGLDYNPSTLVSRWFRFSSGTCAASYIRWGAQPLALDGAEEPVIIRLKGVLPLFTWRGDAPGTVPPNVTVDLTMYDDPYLNAITGGQPRTAALTVSANKTEWGWLHEPLEGRLLAAQLGIGEMSSTLLQGFRGLALDYEILSGS